MGRTVPSAAILLMQEQARYTKLLKKTLSPSDQRALEQLFIYAKMHVAEAAFTAFELPMEIFILAMILEMHKEVIRLRKEII